MLTVQITSQMPDEYRKPDVSHSVAVLRLQRERLPTHDLLSGCMVYLG